jgi:hypothetical protein
MVFGQTVIPAAKLHATKTFNNRARNLDGDTFSVELFRPRTP